MVRVSLCMVLRFLLDIGLLCVIVLILLNFVFIKIFLMIVVCVKENVLEFLMFLVKFVGR